MLKGRLGLNTARVPHVDRHGLLWLGGGTLAVNRGTLVFRRNTEDTTDNGLPQGEFDIPFQTVSMVLLGPGSVITHDALRLLARHGTAMAAVGQNGVRSYTAPPIMPDRSGLARKQARAWADEAQRLDLARRLYAWRLGQVLPHRDIAVLRGIEGGRMKKTYANLAQLHGIEWRGRRYNRGNPNAADIPNQAINHAASAVEAAAAIAVTATATIPQLGFIHEDPGQSFVLDIADLFRDQVTIPAAFSAAAIYEKNRNEDNIERLTRRKTGSLLRKEKVVDRMIERIKQLFEIEKSSNTEQTDANDGSSHA